MQTPTAAKGAGEVEAGEEVPLKIGWVPERPPTSGNARRAVTRRSRAWRRGRRAWWALFAVGRDHPQLTRDYLHPHTESFWAHRGCSTA